MREAEASYREGTGLLNTDPGKAIEALTKSLELNPDAPPALYNRAAAYARVGRDAEAVADIDRLEQVAPELGKKLRAEFRLSAGGYTNIAEEEYRANRFEAAIKKCDSALAYNPKWADAWVVKGLALERLGQPRRAMECYNKGAEAEPGNFLVHLNRAELHEKEGHLQEALADFSKAIDLEPAKPDPYAGRARVYLGLDMKDKATADEIKAAELKLGDGKKGN
jgi:tetratricopeptide (TPR) repeat protein